MTLTISSPVTSATKKGHIYANPGDKVEVIAEHGNVYTVIGKDGQKFTVRKDQIK